MLCIRILSKSDSDQKNTLHWCLRSRVEQTLPTCLSQLIFDDPGKSIKHEHGTKEVRQKEAGLGATFANGPRVFSG